MKFKFLGYDDSSPFYVVQKIESSRTHFAGITIFKENEIPDLCSSTEDSLVSSGDDLIIDVLKNVSKNNKKRGLGKQNLPHDINLRTYAQEKELSEDDFFTDDQSTNEESNDNTEEADVKTVIERYDENVQSTSNSQEIPCRTLNLGFPYMGIPPPPVELDGVKKKDITVEIGFELKFQKLKRSD